MCELMFGKDTCDENWPFTTSHKDVAVSIQHRPHSHVARSCRTTRHSPFLAPVMLPLTLLFDHPRTAEPSMNGFKHRTGTPTPFQHIVAPLTHIGAQQNLPVCGHAHCRRDIVRGGAVAEGVPHPSMATDVLFARSSRVARHDGAGLHRARRFPTRCLRCVPAEAPRRG